MSVPRSVAAVAAVLFLSACADGRDPSATDPGAPPTASGAAATTALPTEPGTTGPAPAEASPDTSTADGVTVALTVADGEVSGSDRRVTVPIGETVTLRVTADVDDGIHVHGYDVHQHVTAGEEAGVSLVADIPGVFEVELESSGILLVELEVR